MTYYRIDLDVEPSLGSMAAVADLIEDGLRARGYSEGEYEIGVHGPPELRIVVRERS